MRAETQRALLAALVLFVAAVLFRVLPYQDPLAIDLSMRLLEPSSEHFLGTDDLGRDLLGRVVLGTSNSLLLSLLAIAAATLIGLVLGLVAAQWRDSYVDWLISGVGDVLMSLPFLLVIAGVLSVVGPSLQNAYVVLVAVMWVAPARVARAEATRMHSLKYVLAARGIGMSKWRINTHVIAPVCAESCVTFAFSYLPEVIGLEAGLSFIGLGIQPPTPSLGKLIFDGLNFVGTHWWLALSPAAFLVVCVLFIQAVSLERQQTWR